MTDRHEASEGFISRTSAAAILVPVAIGSLLVLPSVVWIALDRRVWPWDQAWYGEVTFDLWATLVDAPARWPDAMTSAFGSKPPGIAWLGQFFLPLGSILGDQRALLASIVVCQIGSLAMIFAAARRLGAGPAPALAGALVLGASPLFVWTTHEYLAEALQTLTVAWSLLLLASAARPASRLTLATQVPGLVAVAMLSKLSSPLYIGLPLAAAAILLARTRGSRYGRPAASLRAPGTITAAACSALIVAGALLWYAPNLGDALEHARSAGADTGLYGTDTGLRGEFPEWVDRMADSTFLPAVGVGMAVVVLAAVGVKLIRHRHFRASRSMLVAGVCLTEIVLVVLAFATQANEESRFLLPAVPFVALLVALALTGAPHVLTVVSVAVLAAELAFVTLQGFGVTWVSELEYYRLKAPVRSTWLRDELTRLVDLTCTEHGAGRITLVGAEQPWFNANTLALTASDRNSRVARKCYYTSLGYAESDPDRAWARLKSLDPPYYVTIDYGSTTNLLPVELRADAARQDPFNRIDRAIFARVRDDPKFAVLPGSQAGGFIIFERLTTLG